MHVGWGWAFGFLGVVAVAVAVASGRAKTRTGQMLTRVVAVGIVLSEILLWLYVQPIRIE